MPKHEAKEDDEINEFKEQEEENLPPEDHENKKREGDKNDEKEAKMQRILARKTTV